MDKVEEQWRMVPDSKLRPPHADATPCLSMCVCRASHKYMHMSTLMHVYPQMYKNMHTHMQMMHTPMKSVPGTEVSRELGLRKTWTQIKRQRVSPLDKG